MCAHSTHCADYLYHDSATFTNDFRFYTPFLNPEYDLDENTSFCMKMTRLMCFRSIKQICP